MLIKTKNNSSSFSTQTKSVLPSKEQLVRAFIKRQRINNTIEVLKDILSLFNNGYYDQVKVELNTKSSYYSYELLVSYLEREGFIIRFLVNRSRKDSITVLISLFNKTYKPNEVVTSFRY